MKGFTFICSTIPFCLLISDTALLPCHRNGTVFQSHHLRSFKAQPELSQRTSELVPYPRTLPSLDTSKEVAKPACTCTYAEQCSTGLQEQQITEVPQFLPHMCSSKSITSAKLRFTSQCSTEQSRQAPGNSTVSPSEIL